MGYPRQSLLMEHIHVQVGWCSSYLYRNSRRGIEVNRTGRHNFLDAATGETRNYIQECVISV